MKKPKKKRTPKFKLPADPWQAFAYLVSKCSDGFARELVDQGKTSKQARLIVVGCFLAMAAGEACRIAMSEGRKPDVRKWRKATRDAFKRAVARTAKAAPEKGSEPK